MPQAAQQIGVTEQTYYRWHKKFVISFVTFGSFLKQYRDAVAYHEKALPLLKEDIEACNALSEHFEKLKASGDDTNAWTKLWPELYRVKAKAIETYLSENKGN